MKKTEFAEIKKMEAKDLAKQSEKRQQELAELILDKNTGKLTDLKTVNKKRRELAQMLTVLRQKQQLEKMEQSHGK